MGTREQEQAELERLQQQQQEQQEQERNRAQSNWQQPGDDDLSTNPVIINR